MSCWVYTFVLSNFFFLFYIVFFCFFSRRHSGWFYAQAWKSTRFPFVFLDCTVTTHSVSELLTVFVSGCSTSCGHLPWISVVLLCLSLSLFLSFFSYFLNHSFTVVSARSWYTAPLVTTTIVWLCLLILISK